MRSIADMDLSAQVNIVDFIAFLNAWAAGDARADLNGDGLVDTDDFAIYLAAFLEARA